MSEYQYYEFQAIDRPLAEPDRAELRRLSTRARITRSSFTNSYDWGEFKGDPDMLMQRWFDLHLYVTNWGVRRLMIRWPRRSIDEPLLAGIVEQVEGVEFKLAGENVVLDIWREREELDEGWDDGTGWLTALRNDVLGGDLRLFYLLWLMAVETGTAPLDAPEPLTGIGP